MIDDEQKKIIKEEEIFRKEIQTQLKEKKHFIIRIFNWFNTPLIILLISAYVIDVASEKHIERIKKQEQ